MIARMLSGDPSIAKMYDSRSWFNHCAPAVEAMSRNCLQDLHHLLHFVDDWEINEDENWEYVYDHIEQRLDILKMHTSNDGKYVLSLENG